MGTVHIEMQKWEKWTLFRDLRKLEKGKRSRAWEEMGDTNKGWTVKWGELIALRAYISNQEVWVIEVPDSGKR